MFGSLSFISTSRQHASSPPSFLILSSIYLTFPYFHISVNLFLFYLLLDVSVNRFIFFQLFLLSFMFPSFQRLVFFTSYFPFEFPPHILRAPLSFHGCIFLLLASRLSFRDSLFYTPICPLYISFCSLPFPSLPLRSWTSSPVFSSPQCIVKPLTLFLTVCFLSPFALCFSV